MAVEIEKRARFDEAKRNQLLVYLLVNADDLGVNDKHIFFYVLPDKLLKVVDNVAAGTAKISLKGSKIGQGSAFPEVEFEISRTDVQAAVSVFNSLGFEGVMHDAFNERHDFQFEGVEIALKFSEAWGYHAEFEVLLDDDAASDEHAEANDRIEAVARKLDVHLMSEQELAEFVHAFEQSQEAGQPAS